MKVSAKAQEWFKSKNNQQQCQFLDPRGSSFSFPGVTPHLGLDFQLRPKMITLERNTRNARLTRGKCPLFKQYLHCESVITTVAEATGERGRRCRARRINQGCFRYYPTPTRQHAVIWFFKVINTEPSCVHSQKSNDLWPTKTHTHTSSEEDHNP